MKVISNQSIDGARVLITGGAGMIGSHIARLAEAGGARVTILDVMLPQSGGNRFNFHEIEDNITFRQGDIRDLEQMQRAVPGQDLIFNLAGQASHLDSNQAPLLDLDINCRGHLTILEACRTGNRTARLIFASSRMVYGAIRANPVDEQHPLNCQGIYGIHKLTAEKYYRYYYEAHGLETVSLRIANSYGPRQQMRHNRYGIVNWFIRLALDGKPLTVYGDGRQQRDYIFSEDLAAAFLAAALTPGTAGEAYNVGSGQGTSLRDLARLVAEAVPGTTVVQEAWPEERKLAETGDYISNLDKIGAATSWRPRVSLEEGIARTVSFYREHRQHYW